MKRWLLCIGQTQMCQRCKRCGVKVQFFCVVEKIKIKKQGVNKLVWNLVPDGVDPIKGLITLGGNSSPKIRSGMYHLQMIYAGDTLKTDFQVLEDVEKAVYLEAQETMMAGIPNDVRQHMLEQLLGKD